ncbi:uncharacterized protein B0H18DRAFT_1215194 [Fomitopsis serialis]|uniref:uncharacterized protein n=1 Tax=Fomitopsis serialis TaxID=139415 RepID=UPI002008DE8F|nr:uncharacterized protein B0H18DRAFT_1215194 [Neoantrodia serialis]KAH9916150.1 hypothetical protein B0H18DRAFT_1215194 [Neoantrodia serialis]
MPGRSNVLAIASASTQYLARLATLSEEHHLAVVLLHHGGLHHVRTEMRHGDYGRWATANVDLLMRLIEGHEPEREAAQWRCELGRDARQGGRDVGCTELRSGLGSGLKVLSACKKVEPRMTTVCSTLAAGSIAGVDPEVWERRSRRPRGSLAAFWALVLRRLVLRSRRLRNRLNWGRPLTTCEETGLQTADASPGPIPNAYINASLQGPIIRGHLRAGDVGEVREWGYMAWPAY